MQLWEEKRFGLDDSLAMHLPEYAETRVFAGMDRIDRACPSTAVVVTHGNAGVAVIQWWLRLDEHCRQGISFELDPASVSELAINAWQERTIVRLNDTSHLQQHVTS